MTRILLSIGLLVLVVSCARPEEPAAQQPTEAASTPVPAATDFPPTATPRPTNMPATDIPRPTQPPPTNPPPEATQEPRPPGGAFDDVRIVLNEFNQARVKREDARVKELMTPELLANIDTIEGQVPVFQLSNPCWYRFVIHDLNLDGTTASARVQIYEHYWSGDSGGGPPDSFDQLIQLEKREPGWRVSELGKLENQQSQPTEPHGPNLSACVEAQTPKSQSSSMATLE